MMENTATGPPHFGEPKKPARGERFTLQVPFNPVRYQMCPHEYPSRPGMSCRAVKDSQSVL